MCNDAPDTSGINAAAVKSAELGDKALAWYQSAYEDQRPLREQAAATSKAVSDAQLRLMDTQTRLAEKADAEREPYREAEAQMLRDAQSFDTEAERERLAGLAGGDVEAAAAGARQAAQRSATRMGVNPADGAFGANNVTLANATTLAKAGAMTKARNDAMQLGRALKMDAVSLGRNLPSQQATATQLALSAGNAGAGNAQTPVSLAQAATDAAGRGYQMALQGTGQSGNLYGQAANLGRSNDNVMGDLVNLGMAGKYIFSSDKKQKTGRKPVKTEVALAAARQMPVESWRYKKGSPADDGGRTHVGPMAQAVHKAAGDAAAPGGTTIDGISMHGITLAAVQELDKKHAKLEKAVVALAHARRPAARRGKAQTKRSA